MSVNLKVIGIIHSKYKTTFEAPRQGKDEISRIEIYKEYIEGLTDIDGFSHLHVYYWLHKSEGFSNLVKTPWDENLHGVFTTRSPHRPNPIAHSVVELIEREENILSVKRLDAIEGTPVIDIKPYVKSLDFKENAKTGWMEKTKL
jgi:tRNA-Thr(GGU) m(6)t(6)A37 methyltransferase TsaA